MGRNSRTNKVKKVVNSKKVFTLMYANAHGMESLLLDIIENCKDNKKVECSKKLRISFMPFLIKLQDAVNCLENRSA